MGQRRAVGFAHAHPEPADVAQSGPAGPRRRRDGAVVVASLAFALVKESQVAQQLAPSGARGQVHRSGEGLSNPNAQLADRKRGPSQVEVVGVGPDVVGPGKHERAGVGLDQDGHHGQFQSGQDAHVQLGPTAVRQPQCAPRRHRHRAVAVEFHDHRQPGLQKFARNEGVVRPIEAAFLHVVGQNVRLGVHDDVVDQSIALPEEGVDLRPVEADLVARHEHAEHRLPAGDQRHDAVALLDALGQMNDRRVQDQAGRVDAQAGAGGKARRGHGHVGVGAPKSFRSPLRRHPQRRLGRGGPHRTRPGWRRPDRVAVLVTHHQPVGDHVADGDQRVGRIEVQRSRRLLGHEGQVGAAAGRRQGQPHHGERPNAGRRTGSRSKGESHSIPLSARSFSSRRSARRPPRPAPARSPGPNPSPSWPSSSGRTSRA